MDWQRIIMREKERQKKERWKNMEKSKYNEWYKRSKGEGMPGYFRNKWRKGRWQRMTRFGLENKMSDRRYWKKEDRMFGMEREI